jgi:transposase
MIKKAFGDDSLSEAQIKLWYRRFKNGWESAESDPRSGRPSTRTTENVECVRAAINENRRLTVRELEEVLGIPRTITKKDYIEVLRRLRDAVRRRRPQMWASGDWQLHHDNGPAHSAVLLQAFFCKT